MASYKDIIKKKQSEWKADDLMTGAHADSIAKIPLSSPFLNFALYGGIPRKRMTEFYGDPGSGKSTTAVDACKNAHKLFVEEHKLYIEELRKKIANGNKGAISDLQDAEENGPRKVLYLDLEHGFDKKWAETLGIRPGEVDVMQPPDVPAEEVLQTVQEIVETGEVGFIVLDSLPSLVPKAELEKKYGERTVASLAGLLTIFCRKIVPMLTRYDCTLLVINQVRENMDNPYVVKTPGGVAPKFYASLRILFRLGTPVDFLGNELPQSTENPAGYNVQAKITKQKSAPFDRKNASYILMCDSGIKPLYDYTKLAISKYGIVKKAGAWFTLCNPYTGEVMEDDKGMPIKLNGLAKVYAYLEANTEYYDTIVKFIEDDLNGIPSSDESDSNIGVDDDNE